MIYPEMMDSALVAELRDKRHLRASVPRDTDPLNIPMVK